MSNDAKQVPIPDLLLQWSTSDKIDAMWTPDHDGGTGHVTPVPPGTMREAADRILALEAAAREVGRLCASRSIESKDGPGNNALAELRALVE